VLLCRRTLGDFIDVSEFGMSDMLMNMALHVFVGHLRIYTLSLGARSEVFGYEYC
jgi:hypothetical protein